MPNIDTKKLLGISVENCPICGKKPTVIIHMDDLTMDFDGKVTVRCKKLFRKSHLTIDRRGTNPTETTRLAITAWNNVVIMARMQ